MIWQVVTGTWYQPYYMDGTTNYNISNEVNEINRLLVTAPFLDFLSNMIY